MDLKTFISPMPPDKREEFARKCLTSLGHIQNIMYRMKPCATDLAVRIERESHRGVTRQELRDDWANHWPELVQSNDKNSKSWDGWDGITERRAEDRVTPAAMQGGA